MKEFKIPKKIIYESFLSEWWSNRKTRHSKDFIGGDSSKVPTDIKKCMVARCSEMADESMIFKVTCGKLKEVKEKSATELLKK